MVIALVEHGVKKDWIRSVSLSADGRRMSTSGGDGCAVFWSVDSMQVPASVVRAMRSSGVGRVSTRVRSRSSATERRIHRMMFNSVGAKEGVPAAESSVAGQLFVKNVDCKEVFTAVSSDGDRFAVGQEDLVVLARGDGRRPHTRGRR